MKIDEMAEIQDVMKCSKDKKYATQVKAKLKDIKSEVSQLKSQVYALNTKLREAQQEAQKINRILAQAKGLIVVNDIPITVVTRGRYGIYIDRAGDGLKKYASHPFEIHKRFKKAEPGDKKRQSYVDSIRFNGKYIGSFDYSTRVDRIFPDFDFIKDIGCKYVAGLLSADDALKLIDEKSVFKKREGRW